MISSECQKRRFDLNVQEKKYSVLTKVFGLQAQDNVEKKMNFLEAFAEERSLSAGICLEKWKELPQSENIARAACDRHVVVVDAMKWSEVHQSCEVHVRNSVAATDLQGWVSADRLINSVFSTIRIGEDAAIPSSSLARQQNRKSLSVGVSKN